MRFDRRRERRSAHHHRLSAIIGMLSGLRRNPVRNPSESAATHGTWKKTGGRKKGTPNKTTALLKDAVLRAAEAAGGPPSKNNAGGLVAYLTQQASANPAAFMTLLGKVLPMQLTGDGGGPVETKAVSDAEPPRSVIERRIAALAMRASPDDAGKVH